MKVQEISGVTEYAGTLTRVHGYLPHIAHVWRSGRCDRSTPQYKILKTPKVEVEVELPYIEGYI